MWTTISYQTRHNPNNSLYWRGLTKPNNNNTTKPNYKYFFRHFIYFIYSKIILIKYIFNKYICICIWTIHVYCLMGIKFSIFESLNGKIQCGTKIFISFIRKQFQIRNLLQPIEKLLNDFIRNKSLRVKLHLLKLGLR